MKIVLIGFATSGKSTVGAILAKHLNLNFYDTDLLIEQAEHTSIQQIFTERGEEYFRQLENNILQQLCNVDNAVIALGGGSVLCSNFSTLAQNSTVVWLQVNAESVVTRLQGNNTRPLFSGQPPEKISQLLDKRTPLYQAASNFAVDTNCHTPKEVAQQILQLKSHH